MKHQKGVSLIEMMIALSIGLVLLIGVGAAYLTMKQTYSLRQNMSRVQSNERIAMVFIDTNIRNAGAYPNPLVNTAATLFPAAGSFVAGQSLLGTGSNAGADTLSVRFAADAVSANQGCSGPLSATDVYTDVFSVTGGFLTCTETHNPTPPPTPPNPASTINLIAGLTGMNIKYGIDTTGGGSVTQYLTGDQVTAQTYWLRVKTVTVTLLFANPLAGQPGQVATLSLTKTIPYMVGL